MNKLIIRSLYILSVIVTVSLLTAVCYASNNKTVIKVGSEIEFPPFAIVAENGQAGGFSIELIEAVAKAMDMPIVITVGPWDTMWNGLVSGQLDVLPVVAKSSERQQLVDFSLSHTETFDAFFVRSGSPEISDIKSAQGKKIVVMRSDAAHHELLERKFQGDVVLVDNIPEGLKMVASGKNDAFLCSKLIGILTIKKYSIKGLKGGPLVPEYKRVFSFGVRKGADELREKLNQGLLIVKSSGEYDRIYEKWLGFDDPWRKYKRYLLISVVLLGVIAVAALFWSAMLRIIVKKRTEELAIKNASLEQEIENRKRIEEELRKHREELELLIEERTSALRTSEVKFRNLFNNSEIGMFRTRIDGSEIVDANEKLLNIFGRTREEVIGKPSVIHWADPREREEMIKKLKEHGRVADFECRMLNKNGEVRHCITSLRLYSEEGIEEGTIMDITRRKLAEKKLQRSEEKYRQLHESITDAFAVVDMQGQLREFNKAFQAMLGYSQEELLNLTYVELTPEKWHADEAVIVKEQVLQRGHSDIYQKEYRKKDGTIFPVEVRTFLIKNETDNPVAMWAIVRDITERKKAEEEREKLILELREALAKVKTLSGMLPICASCKKIRDDKGYWNRIESYITNHSDVLFSHGICPECEKKAYEELENHKNEAT